jgi:SufS family cysteine desulfurase
MAPTSELAREPYLGTDEWAQQVRSSFPFFNQPGVSSPIYLDNSATTQKPSSVIEAMSEFYATANVNGGRGMYRLSVEGNETFSAARNAVARFLGGVEFDEVIYTKNATESVNLVARTFGEQVVGAGDEVVISGMEHHSNLLPWRQLCERQGARLIVIPPADGCAVTPDELERFLSPRVKLVAITHISNVLGTVNPVDELVQVSHRHGIPILIDGAQAVSRRPIRLREMDADFYVFSAHKMYGPTGVGVLFAKREHLKRMPPYHLGGGTVLDVSYDRELGLTRIPYLFEPGTPNIAGAVGLAVAIEFLESLDWTQVMEHDANLAVAAAQGLAEIDGVTVLGDPLHNQGGIVSFVVKGLHPYDVGMHLNEYGIGVRTGVHCAIPLVDSFDIVGTVRVSFGVYNTMAEVQSLLSAVRTAGPGMWTTQYPDQRLLPRHGVEG